MKITKVEVRNFRILECADIAFDYKSTLIVGRNNSGKTSLTEIFYKFLGTDQNQFKFDDMSITKLKNFREAYKKYQVYQEARKKDDTGESLQKLDSDYKILIPRIELKLFIAYEADDDLGTLSDFIMDLDEERKDALLVCTYQITKPEKMFQDFSANEKTYDNDVVKFLKKNYRSYFSEQIFAVDERDQNNAREVFRKDVEKVFLPRFIYAQNKLDDLSTDKTQGLSKGFGDFYKFNSKEKASTEDIDAVLAKLSDELETQYSELFKSIFEDLKTFGVGRIANLQELKIKALFEAEKILKGNTQLFYSHGEDGDLLPEAHNGLGYTKLIFTILQFISFYEEYRKRDIRPSFQLIFVEEPEAHLHPQMQYVFMKNIREFISKKENWNVQVIITTHSSHIVAESGFNCIRYFDNSVEPLKVKNLSEFREALRKTDPDSVNFLEQYMTLHRCDMFFADKVILIEGTVERLLLPEMIKKHAEELLHQYVSVVEVGGAYAVKFKELLEFINVQTLIITDIDSVDPSTNHSSCKVGLADAVSSNITLKEWLPKKTKIAEILAVDDSNKASGRIRVAYQIPEKAGSDTGRSFEEAFILCNAKLLSEQYANLSVEKAFRKKDGSGRLDSEVLAESYDIARSIEKKTDFAFDIISLESWETPKYIKDGLIWLSKTL